MPQLANYSSNKFLRYIQQVITPPANRDSELAVISNQYYKDYRIYAYNPDVLVTRKGLTIFDSMKRDDQIKPCLKAKKLLIFSNGWEITPANSTPKAQEQVDFLYVVFEQLQGTLEKTVREIMSALDYGYSVSEKVFNTIEKGAFKGKIGLKYIKTKKPHDFTFDVDNYGNIKPDTGLWQYNGQHKYPTWKFIIYSHDSEWGNPYGTSDLAAAYRAWWSKDLIYKFYNGYLEKFGSPTLKITYPQGASPGLMSKIEEVLKNFVGGQGIKIPEGLKAELLEAMRQGQAGYDRAIDIYNTAIARSLLVPDLLGFTGKEAGTYALGAKQADLFLANLMSIQAELAEEVLGEQLIRQLIDWNYPGTDEYPAYEFGSLRPDDMQVKATVIRTLVEPGIVGADEPWIRPFLNLPERVIAELTSKEYAEKKLKFNRKINKYEEKVNFNQIIIDIEEDSVELGLELIRPIMQDSLDDIKKQVEKLDLKSPKDIENISMKYVGDIKLAFQNILLRAYKKGGKQARQEVKKAKAKKYQISMSPLTPVKMLEYFKSKSKKMSDDLSDNVIKQVKTILYNGYKQGDSLRDMIHKLDEKFKEWVDSGEVDPETGEAFTPSRLETIIRTNANEAYNSSRLEEWKQDEDKYVEAVMYSAIMDDRVTEQCAAMDGLIMAISNPLIETICPSKHYNCRSILIPITADEKYEISPDSDWQEGIALIPDDFK
jgi:SPP1 gp7 family putative phage head morphogenesis protein